MQVNLKSALKNVAKKKSGKEIEKEKQRAKDKTIKQAVNKNASSSERVQEINRIAFREKIMRYNKIIIFRRD